MVLRSPLVRQTAPAVLLPKCESIVGTRSHTHVRRVFAKRYTVTRLGLGWEGLILNLLYANPAIRFLPTPNPRPQPCDCSWVTWERLGTVLGLSCTPIFAFPPFFRFSSF